MTAPTVDSAVWLAARAHWCRRLGRTIAAARHASGMTQHDLAAVCRTSHITVSRWERGVSAPDSYSLALACAAIGADPAALLTLAG